jgi:hypothetical protein
MQRRAKRDEPQGRKSAVSELSDQQKYKRPQMKRCAFIRRHQSSPWPLGDSRIELAIAACKHLCHSHVTGV